MSAKRASPNYDVPALEKGLDILEALSRADVPQNRSDLARALGRSPSEIFRMLDCLEKRRYVERDPLSGCYRLTLRLFELAHTHTPMDQMLRVARSPMGDLAEQIEESCHLSVLSNDHTLVIGRALSPAPVRLSTEIGLRLPVLHTVSGRLLLAYLSDEDRRRFLENSSEFEGMSRDKKRLLEATFEDIRRKGYSFARSEYRTGMDVAVLVGNPAIDVSAALAVPCMAGGANDGREEEIVGPMLQCAQAITTALGLSGEIRAKYPS